MERNTTLTNFKGLKEFIISNRVTAMKKNTKQRKEKNTCIQEYGEEK